MNMDQTIALWIIQTSIIAAGIIFGLYNFLPPMLSGFLQVRTESPIAQIDDEDISRIKRIMNDLRKLKDLPWLISRGLIVIFGLYLLSALFCVLFLLDMLSKIQIPVDLTLWLFLIATVLFILIGGLLLKSIRDVVYEQLRGLLKEKERKEKQTIF